MVNLFLVVIATQFSETKRRETEKIAEERKRYRSSTTLTSTKTESDGCYNQLLKYIIHTIRRNIRKLKRHLAMRQDRKRRQEGDPNVADVRLRVFGNHINCQPCSHVMTLLENAPIASPEPSDIDSVTLSYMPRKGSSHSVFRRSSRTCPLNEPVILVSNSLDGPSVIASDFPTALHVSYLTEKAAPLNLSRSPIAQAPIGKCSLALLLCFFLSIGYTE